MQTTPEFTITLRGYDPGQVQALVRQGEEALAATDPQQREAARQALLSPKLDITLRGYDQSEVNTYLNALATTLA